MADKQGPNYTRLRWVKSKDKQVLATWFEGLGFRVTIWSAVKDDKGVWDILYVPDDRITTAPPIDLDLDILL